MFGPERTALGHSGRSHSSCVEMPEVNSVAAGAFARFRIELGIPPVVPPPPGAGGGAAAGTTVTWTTAALLGSGLNA
jgi:hypothetical protein